MDSIKSVKIIKSYAPSFIKTQPDPAKPQLKIYIDQELCIGCGLCREVCPFGLPEKSENKRFSIQRLNECIECSACKRNCPSKAIIMSEKQGCGCLWDVRNRTKLLKKGGSGSSCCS